MGLATAKLLASRGAIVSLGDINEASLKTAAKSLTAEERHMYTVVDVRQSRSVDAWIRSTVDRFGKLDGAVNMAGVISPAKPIKEESDETWDFNFDVNARGVFFCIRAQLRAMSAGGSIVSYLSPLRRVSISRVLNDCPGFCRERLRTDGISRCVSLLRQQGGGDWFVQVGGQREQAHPCQLCLPR